MNREIVHVRENLRGQLARRRQHERARRPARPTDEVVRIGSRNAAVLPLPVYRGPARRGRPAPEGSLRTEWASGGGSRAPAHPSTGQHEDRTMKKAHEEILVRSA